MSELIDNSSGPRKAMLKHLILQLHETCDHLLAPEAAGLLERVGAHPAVKTAPHNDGPGVFRTAEEALRASARQAERPPPPATKEG